MSVGSTLIRVIIPSAWKIGRVVLIEKPSKVGFKRMSYKPLCILNEVERKTIWEVDSRDTIRP